MVRHFAQINNNIHNSNSILKSSRVILASQFTYYSIDVNLPIKKLNTSWLVFHNKSELKVVVVKCLIGVSLSAGEPGASEEESRGAERERAAVQEAAERESESGRPTVLPQEL